MSQIEVSSDEHSHDALSSSPGTIAVPPSNVRWDLDECLECNVWRSDSAIASLLLFVAAIATHCSSNCTALNVVFCLLSPVQGGVSADFGNTCLGAWGMIDGYVSTKVTGKER
jgi:hypothetical protein